MTSIDELKHYSSTRTSRGVRRLRAALKLARVGAESRMETLLRLLMAAHGLDILGLQVTVRGADGTWIGRFDMADHVRKLIIEYDGEQHRTSNAQYERDQNRVDDARNAGYRVLRVRRKQLIDEPMRTVRRIAELLGLPLRPVTGQLAAYFAE